ncbi:4-cresol dehydrogenase (hydroxylating) [Desulfonatronum thiosulfatophilum]|uniref:4-cresol dehydrogenase (Hydroxylating) n=1 Tax=Desulfonatronum thiosulfatophilum TaxID=617002 RepID=A0A1G6ELT7_9BACT|nr:FAD-binding oxidoreductase [Desulfonatronum thiosulfatophilum]SDB58344.1 4-cresol dehydrogenase (hydroxylating) [Desulfonatronum thiosulfatophilum]
MKPDVDQAFQDWQTLLGPERARRDQDVIATYSRCTLPEGTTPLGVLYPHSTQEVQKIVAIARRTGISLYPISRGKNWGYGDACAVTSGQVIMDLTGMNRILEVNQELAYAVIEPGVTQKQLYDELQSRNIPLWFDCTGSGPEASIVGNTLERGFGHTPYGDHFYHSCGMEVVLGDGRVVKTGYGHYREAKATHVFKWALGPYLDGLFTQSNLGIVTSMGIWLMPKPECFNMFFLSMPEDDDLPRMVDALRPLKLRGQVKSLVHIGNDVRIISSFQRYPWSQAGGKTPLPEELRRSMRKKGGFGAWNISGAIYGTKGEVRAVRREIRKALGSLGRVRFVGPTSLLLARNLLGILEQRGWRKEWQIMLGALVKVGGLLQGQPTDAFLYGTLWRISGREEPASLDPLENNAGLLWISPIMPMTGNAAGDLVRKLSPIFLEYGFEPLITVSLITERAMVAVTTIAYDRTNPEETKRARECYDALFSEVMRAGYIPYRASIASMSQLAQGSDVFWDVVHDLKRTLDPDMIIARGRYDPFGV